MRSCLVIAGCCAGCRKRRDCSRNGKSKAERCNTGERNGRIVDVDVDVDGIDDDGAKSRGRFKAGVLVRYEISQFRV